MPENWKTYKLTDLGTIARGKSKHRPRDAAHLYEGEYPFIQTSDVKAANHRLNTHTQSYSEAGLAQSKLWAKDTMCITIAANIAETAILEYPACFPDSIIGFVANPEISDIDFVEYLMQYFKKQIQSHSIGSVQDNINLATFQRVEFLVPPLPEQQTIANILSALDDKIENNLATNKTLEDMAMALYKHWFVDFGPFQEGNFIDSELGPIPEGWEVKGLLEIVNLLTGGTPKTKVEEYWNGDIKWVSAKDLGNSGSIYTIETERTITPKGIEKSAAKVLPEDSTVIVARGSVGKMGMLAHPMAINQSCFGLYPKNEYSPGIIYLLVCKLVDRFQRISYGSVFDTITTSAFSTTQIICPPKTIVIEIALLIDPIFKKIKENTFENQTLTQLRDTLLPKLISGEVRLKEFEKEVIAAL